MKVGIVGASGYTGAELMRLLAGHEIFELVVATGDSQANQPIGRLYPSLAAAYAGRVYDSYVPDLLDGLDVVFVALPHGQSQKVIPDLRNRVGHIVDLAADFRLDDPELYPTWYGEPHTQPSLLAQARYGLPELFRSELKGATLVAGPGCYPTAAALALAPLVQAGLVDSTGIIVDALSGVSGAGRKLQSSTSFSTASDNVVAYGLLRHRHTPEIEQTLTLVANSPAQVLFTPHLVPMSRGMLATCYARPLGAVTQDDVDMAMRAAYEAEPFVVISNEPPSTKATLGTNAAHVKAVVDDRTGWVLSMCALDNLGKGASGAAIQCANLVVGLPETTGLSTVGLAP